MILPSVILAVLSSLAGREAVPSTCTKRIQLLVGPKHSLCYAPSKDLTASGIPEGKDRQIILDEHNKYRAGVTPTASNMQMMYWDEEISLMVKGWLSTCVGMKHDPGSQRKSPGKFGTGQNLAAGGFRGWASVVKAWYSEVKDFTYGNMALMKGKTIGHYTQVVWASSTRVGCAWVQCKGKARVYGCNYANAGNLNTKMAEPYKKGPSCSECSGKCKNKLCDCNGKICFNGGQLDLKTCTCKCKIHGQQTKEVFPVDKDCAMDCYKSVDYNFKSNPTKSRICERLSKSSSLASECKRWDKDKACPWLCKACPHIDYRNLPAAAGGLHQTLWMVLTVMATVTLVTKSNSY